MKKRIYLASPHMGESEEWLMKKAFRSNWIAPLGPMVDAFEKKVRTYVGTTESVALSSGTAAIHLALRAIGIKQGDTVFCSDLTFVGSCNPIRYEGAIPVFIDSDEETWNMCPIALAKAFRDAVQLNQLPKAVIVVHLYGQSANMGPIQQIAAKYGVPVIEDAAESLGATYKGMQTGTMGEYGIYSFNGNKIITTSGGGMFVTNNKEVAMKVKHLATQAKDVAPYYEHSELGYNYRMSNLLAAVGVGQMDVLGERIQKKKQIYERYQAAFEEIESITMMPICEYGEPNYWLSTMTLAIDCIITPTMIIEALVEENIESRHVWKPMHLQPYYQHFPFYTSRTYGSISEELFLRGLCLPSDTKMTIEEQDRVIKVIKELMKVEHKQFI